MSTLIAVIIPVFLVIALGYVARWHKLIDNQDTDTLMRFAQGIAIPTLLFRAISQLDLGHGFDLALLGSFYAGAISGFALGLIGARLLGRAWEDSVAIGFACLFSNSLLLGLSITERAYGSGALEPNYAIISIHSPICYGLGITAMELVRARGTPLHHLPLSIGKTMLRNPLIIGILAGLSVNLTGLHLPDVLAQGLDLLTRAALPVALFGLGAVLMQYRPEGDLRIIAMICVIGLMVHPAITYALGSSLGLSDGQFRSAVITAAMAPGINAYLFANMYGVAQRVAASAVLAGTIICVITATFWLHLLP